MSVPSLIVSSLLNLTKNIEQMVLLSNLVIASLGSSYASGPGIVPQLDPKEASRSGNNYAHLLAAKLPGSDLTDLSISGATLSTILNKTQTSGGVTFQPQLNGVPADADLVLILGGGNDINYNGGLIGDTNSSVDVSALSQKYGTVLDAIHEKAENAQVMVVTYLTVLGGDVIPAGEPGANVAFNASRVAYHQGIAEKLRQATVGAIDGREEWAEVLDVVEPSWSHGVGSSDPWMNGNTDPKYHPIAEGHVAIADMLYERLCASANGKVQRKIKARL